MAVKRVGRQMLTVSGCLALAALLAASGTRLKLEVWRGSNSNGRWMGYSHASDPANWSTRTSLAPYKLEM